MDNKTFWTLLEGFHAEAARFCRRLTGDKSEGDDLFHESLLVGLERFDQLRSHETFKPWLYRIIVNRYRNRCRGWWLKARVDLTPEQIELSRTDHPAGKLELRRTMTKALSLISPENRAMIVMHDVEGRTIDEIGGPRPLKTQGTAVACECRIC